MGFEASNKMMRNRLVVHEKALFRVKFDMIKRLLCLTSSYWVLKGRAI